MMRQKLEKIVSNGKKIFLGAAVASAITFPCLAQQPTITSIAVNNPSTGSVTNRGYFVNTVGNETKIYKEGHHFLSVLSQNGIFALRPHPGDDVDGWGSTLYLQPFVNDNLGNTSPVRYSLINDNGTNKVRINANGKVSGTSFTDETWSTQLDFVYNPSNKTITANGDYQINLLRTPSSDFKFFKLASNFLRNVPLNNGTTGNTGDMKNIIYLGDNMYPTYMQGVVWDPANWNGGHFPWDLNNYLEFIVNGDENSVDTVRQGYSAIAKASKPSLRVIMQSVSSEMKVSFGTTYVDYKSQDFTSDNIGVTPWVRPSASVRDYNFNMTLESSALTNDCYSPEAVLTSVDSVKPSYHGVYFSPSMTNEAERIGSIKGSGENFGGKVKVKNPQGFLRVKREQY